MLTMTPAIFRANYNYSFLRNNLAKGKALDKKKHLFSQLNFFWIMTLPIANIGDICKVHFLILAVLVC